MKTPQFSGITRIPRSSVTQGNHALPCVLSLAMLAPPLAAAGEAYTTGLLPEDPETYAATPQASRYRAFLPEEYDLSPYFPPPRHQGKQGSCVAWATGYAVRSYYEARTQSWKPSDPTRQFSPAFIYNQVKAGSCEVGSSISKALGLLKKNGALWLANFPYDESNCTRLPDARATSAAIRFRIDGWKRVDTDRLDDMKGQIFAGHPVIVGMQIPDSFYRLKRGIYDDTHSPSQGGHAMVVVGYSEPKQAFKLMNSWGQGWGEGGFGWISYQAARQRIQSAFVMTMPTPVPDRAPLAGKPEHDNTEPAPESVAIPPRQEASPKAAPLLTKVESTPSADLKQKIADLIASAKCADLRGTVGADGQVTLRGFTGEWKELERIAFQLRQAGARVSDDVVLRPWPQCEALVSFREALTKPDGLRITIKGADSARLSAGDHFHIEVTTPNYPSYLYLTYLQANGDAVHLAKPGNSSPQLLPPNTQLVFGQGEAGQPKYRIGPPFGDEMIVAIATDTPLFDEDLPGRQAEREYLTQFRQAFLLKHGTKVHAVSAATATLVTLPTP